MTVYVERRSTKKLHAVVYLYANAPIDVKKRVTDDSPHYFVPVYQVDYTLSADWKKFEVSVHSYFDTPYSQMTDADNVKAPKQIPIAAAAPKEQQK